MKIGDRVKVITNIYHNGLNLKDQYGIISGRIIFFKDKPPAAYYVDFEFIPDALPIKSKSLEFIR